MVHQEPILIKDHSKTVSASGAAACRDRYALFDEWISRINSACGAFSATLLGDTFVGGFNDYQSGAVRLSVVEAAQTRLYRTAQDIGRSDDDKYFAVLQLRGQASFEQGEQRAQLAKGDITLLDAARPCSGLLGSNSRQISLILPRQLVERHMQQTRVACAQLIPAASALAAMAARLMLAASQQSKTGLCQQESEAILDALVTLLKPAIGRPDAPDDSHERMFRKACALIDAHLDSDKLSPEWIAQSIGISVRGLYRVFSRQGLVVAQYVKHRRLDLCAEALRQATVSEKMSSLGYSWGFADSSHFSSAFKTRFGMPPGEYRKRYRQQA